MRPVPLLLLILSCALAADAAAQATPSPRRPAADSIRMAEEGNVVSIDEMEEEPAADTVPVPQDGPYARAGGTGPFTVQASGEPSPRPARGEVVWVNSAPARPAARDTARTGSGQRVTSGQTTRRDTARTRPPGTTTTPTTGQTNTAGRRSRSHTVVAGETFYGIARRYGVTAAQLRALNPDVDMDALEVGDVLRLPAGARDSRASAQPQGRTGTAAPTPPRGSRTHTVAAGETLFGIARRYGVTVAAIRQANGMAEDQDQVRAGQRLVIPPAR